MRILLLVPAAMLALLVAGPLAFGSVFAPDAGAGFPSHDDIPPVAMRAYVSGARLTEDTHPDCVMTWALLAGIGKVESDHGRYGGGALDEDGRADPPIIGIALDGRPGVAAIADTDGGRHDGDATWDRAVGPMQFIPGTWRWAGVDGDGNRTADPQDIDDAAAAAGGLLCSTRPGDYTDLAQVRVGVLTYNRSTSYVERVIGHMLAYLAQATTELAPGDGPIACPVVEPVDFIDSWGFPRSGGRTHKGQDMFAPRGRGLVAVADGVITALGWAGRLGGQRIWLTTADDQAWYYAHLDSFAPDLAVGDRVQRGQVIGTVGNTGNAATTPAHLHIQWRPRGRHTADVNSYALLDAACPSHRG